MTKSTDDHKLLVENNREAVKVFEYLLSLLSDKPTKDSLGYLYNKTDKILELREHGKSVIINSTVVYVQTLIDKIAELVIDCMKKLVSISREYVVTDNSTDIHIKLHGDETIESDGFIVAMQSIHNYDKVRALLYRMFITTHNSSNSIHNLLRVMSIGDVNGDKQQEQLKSDNFIWFERSMKANDVTKEIVKSVFITSVIKAMVCEELPESLIGIKAYKSHVDLVILSSDNHDISFNSDIDFGDVYDQSTQYYHVHYQGVSYNNANGSGTISVKSAGMFSLDKLQAMLAQKEGLAKTAVISWKEIKDEKSYIAFNS